ncbi:MAG: PIN domain-containing protein [Bryobacterales bacterium]|nr:PIN domain-containing protein [Bryobacterales bacterium]
MIAADSSTLIAFFQGDDGHDVDLLDKALEAAQVVLPPVVLAEVLSDPWLRSDFADLIRLIPVLEIRSGYWERAASTRARILSRRLRARLADSLISQSCLDHETPLITRDRDFRHFAEFAGLQLA